MKVKYKSETPASDKNSLHARMAATSVQDYDKLGFTRVGLPEGSDVYEAINEFKKNPNVEYAEPVYIYKATDTTQSSTYPDVRSVAQSVYSLSNPDDPYLGQQWGISVTNMVYAWEDVNGSARHNITIAILDSGVDHNHPDLQDSMVGGKRVLGLQTDSDINNILTSGPTNDPNSTDDDFGHGTHVAGIAAAVDNNSTGIAGVAGGVNIMPVKVLDSNGEGNSIDIFTGIKWAVDHGAKIINR